jgi:hypothetical protein
VTNSELRSGSAIITNNLQIIKNSACISSSVSKTATKINNMLKLALAEEKMIRTQSFWWFLEFKRGMTSAKRCQTFSVQQEKWKKIQVRKLVHRNRDLIIHELVNVTGVLSGSSQNTLTQNLNI